MAKVVPFNNYFRSLNIHRVYLIEKKVEECAQELQFSTDYRRVKFKPLNFDAKASTKWLMQ